METNNTINLSAIMNNKNIHNNKDDPGIIITPIKDKENNPGIIVVPLIKKEKIIKNISGNDTIIKDNKLKKKKSETSINETNINNNQTNQNKIIISLDTIKKSIIKDKKEEDNNIDKIENKKTDNKKELSNNNNINDENTFIKNEQVNKNEDIKIDNNKENNLVEINDNEENIPESKSQINLNNIFVNTPLKEEKEEEEKTKEKEKEELLIKNEINSPPEEKKEIFTNYKADYKEERNTLFQQIKKLKNLPKTNYKFLAGLIIATALGIGLLFYINPKDHSLQNYKASIINIIYKDEIEQKRIEIENEYNRLQEELKWKIEYIKYAGFNFTVEFRTLDGIKSYKYNNIEYTDRKELDKVLAQDVEKIKKGIIKEILINSFKD